MSTFFAIWIWRYALRQCHRRKSTRAYVYKIIEHQHQHQQRKQLYDVVDTILLDRGEKTGTNASNNWCCIYGWSVKTRAGFKSFYTCTWSNGSFLNQCEMSDPWFSIQWLGIRTARSISVTFKCIICELMRTQLLAIDLPFYCHHCASIVYDWMECRNHLSFFSFLFFVFVSLLYDSHAYNDLHSSRVNRGEWLSVLCMHVPSHSLYVCVSVDSSTFAHCTIKTVGIPFLWACSCWRVR